MRTTLFLELVLFVTTVWAGGYHGALERVWLYYAYEIDGLNDPDDRKLGWRCNKWDSVTKSCNANPSTGQPWWVECKGKYLPGNRCTFSEYVASFDKSQPNWDLVGGNDADGSPLPHDTTTPDPEATAKKLFNRFKNSNVGQVKNPPPFKIFRGAGENYVEFLDNVGNIVIDAESKKTPENQHLFDAFRKCTKLVTIAREGDHGPYLIEAAKKKLPSQGIEVKTKTVGPGVNPIDSSKTWETLDWETTISSLIDGGMSEDEVLTHITEFHDKFYSVGEGLKHKPVMTFYQQLESKFTTCS